MIAMQAYNNVEYVNKLEGGWHDGGGPGIGSWVVVVPRAGASRSFWQGSRSALK